MAFFGGGSLTTCPGAPRSRGGMFEKPGYPNGGGHRTGSGFPGWWITELIGGGAWDGRPDGGGGTVVRGQSHFLKKNTGGFDRLLGDQGGFFTGGGARILAPIFFALGHFSGWKGGNFFEVLLVVVQFFPGVKKKKKTFSPPQGGSYRLFKRGGKKRGFFLGFCFSGGRQPGGTPPAMCGRG